jgi:tRNA(Ile2) C34 agmatinyltransferase TiaS
MARYIDADALMNELRSMVKYENDGAVDCGSYNTAIIDAKAAISSAPTLSPDEVRGVGEWIDSADFEQCSVCNGTQLKEFQSKYGKTIRIRTPYCPSCGARMKGAETDG